MGGRLSSRDAYRRRGLRSGTDCSFSHLQSALRQAPKFSCLLGNVLVSSTAKLKVRHLRAQALDFLP